jgi:RNA polymerase sigma-70 factor (ECF subfamily)
MALRADDVDLGRDRDLVQRFQNGDPSAFDELYRRYFDRLHRFCQRHTGDVHEAEEIAQEAFVKALRSMDTLTGERRFYPWMTVIAKRLTIDRHRKLSRLELTDEPDLGSVEPDVEHLFAAVDAGHVREALAAVGPRHREVLLLREAEGLSYAEIGHQLEVPVTTVEALLHRARKALRREYATVAGDSRGMWGLPIFGLAATRLGQLRAKISERWVEIGAVGAPVVAGAVTAALVLAPADAPSPVEAGAATSTSAASATTDVEPAAPGDPLVVAGTGAGPGAAIRSGPDADGADPPPDVDAGPVDVFVGPEGATRARDEAEEMPVSGELGPAFAGADPLPVARIVEGIDETTRILLDGPDQAGDDPLNQLPGGNP